MAVPLDAIRAIHNAFRKDMTVIYEAAGSAARGNDGLELVRKRYLFFNDILVWHAIGEEESVFPALEKVAPLVAEAYELDHRGLDTLFESLDKAINSSDLLAIARATAAFHFHLGIHLDKEESHLYRIFGERIPLPNQGAIVGEMAQKIPQERFAEVIGWLFPLIDSDDRENMVRIWQKSLPEPAFMRVTSLIKTAIGSDWGQLIRRIPELG